MIIKVNFSCIERTVDMNSATLGFFSDRSLLKLLLPLKRRERERERERERVHLYIHCM